MSVPTIPMTDGATGERMSSAAGALTGTFARVGRETAYAAFLRADGSTRLVPRGLRSPGLVTRVPVVDGTVVRLDGVAWMVADDTTGTHYPTLVKVQVGDRCDRCGDVVEWCPDFPEFHHARGL